MKSNFLMSFLILGLLASCGGDKKSSSTSGGPGNDKNTDTLEAQQFKEAYQFSLNGCDTGKHNFSSNSRDDVKKKLCDALQDDKLNNSCAEPLRKDFFNKKCSSLTWLPKYPTNNNSNSNDNDDQVTNNTHSNNWLIERKIRNSLQNLVASKVTINDQIDEEDKDDAQKLAQSFSDCTFSYTGPKCLNNYAYRSSYLGKVYEVNEEEVFFVELDIQNIDYTVALVFSLKNEDKNYISQKVTVYKSFQKFNTDSDFASYIDDESFVLKLFSSSISENSIEALIKKAKEPSSLREQYHSSKVALDIAMKDSTINYQEKQKELLKYFYENSNLIAESEDSQYQYSMLTFVKNTLTPEQKDFIAICEKLIDVDDQSLKQYAIVHVFDYDPTRNELKNDVLEALEHKKWKIRVKAIEGLSKTNLDLNEQSLVLRKLDDTDRDVRKAAEIAASNFKITEEHIGILSELQSSSRWKTRQLAATLLGKISGSSATLKLVEKMSDNDRDVRAEVRKQLFSRSLTDKDLESLKGQINSKRWDVRLDVITLIGKISGNKATKLIIGTMSDNDQDVRKEALNQLKNRTMSDSVLAELESQLNSNHWDVRRDSAKLIGSIDTEKATIVLIPKMSDNEKDVREEIVTILDGKKLSVNMVASLKTQLNTSRWDTRKEAARFLGTIKVQSSVDALVERLAVETDSDVKKEIKRSIDKIK